MNDTAQRIAAIREVIRTSKKVSNRKIQKHLAKRGWKISRITIIRDVQKLIHDGFVLTEGKGRGVEYVSVRAFERCLDAAPFGVTIYVLLLLGAMCMIAISLHHTLLFLPILQSLFLLSVLYVINPIIRFPSSLLWAFFGWLCFFFLGYLPITIPWMSPFGATELLRFSWILPSLIRFDYVIYALGFTIWFIVLWYALRYMFSIGTPSWANYVYALLATIGLAAFAELLFSSIVLVIPSINVAIFGTMEWNIVAASLGSLYGATLVRRFSL